MTGGIMGLMPRVLAAVFLGAVSVLSSACGSANNNAADGSTSPTTTATPLAGAKGASDASTLDCSPPARTEYVDGVGDGEGPGTYVEGPTPEAALRRYVGVDEEALPDSGYVRVPDNDRDWVDFVLTAEDGRRTVHVWVSRHGDIGWRAVGHARCV